VRQTIANPYVVGRGGLEARLSARVCHVLEAKLGPALANLRTHTRGVDQETAYALMAVREVAMSFVPPEEQAVVATSEQAAVLEWLDTSEAADLMGLRTPRAVTQAIARGRLPAVKVGRAWRIRRTDIEHYRTRAA
jgi:excisionase family DNA binding protein